MRHQQKIQTFDVAQAVLAITNGHPGAMEVCAQLLLHAHLIDPDGGYGGLSIFLLLDQRGIWEEDIWTLYDVVCDEDIGKMIAVLRADQRGQLAGITEDRIRQS